MSNALAIELKAQSAETVSGQGTAVDLGYESEPGVFLPLRTTLVLTVDVDVVTGTLPRLEVHVETSDLATGPWRRIGSLNQVLNENGSDDHRLLVGDCERFVRLDWVIGGVTPSFAFGVSGVAHTAYASRQDMISYGISEHVLDQIEENKKLQALIAASAEMSTNLSVSFTLPIVSWGEDVTKHTAILAAYTVISGNFREGLDEALVDMKDDTMSFLKRIGDGRLRPKTIIDSTPDVEEDSAYIASSTSRGWN
ncbi:MAG: DUF1320 family protein [Halieaceae bacterium]|nr:DUF1320 family protein [Halieaceae bacterium]